MSSTEDYDRGEKLEHYKQIPSLDVIVIAEQDARRVEVWMRDRNGWPKGETIELGSLGCSLALDDVYRDPLA